MRRIAVCRVVSIPEKECLSRQVITIGEMGCQWAPLTEELSHTEWLPGIVVLSPVSVERKVDETFTDMIERLCESTKESESFQAYWINPFDAANMLFLPTSRVVCLSSSSEFGADHSCGHGHVE